MPNKYNIRAKRQELDGLIRDRSWKTFGTRFSLIANQSKEDGSSSNDDDANHSHDMSLCQAVVECRNRQTNSRSLLHSLCNIRSDSSPPPADLIRSVAWSCPSALHYRDSSSGRTPLHLAIIRRSPIGVIEALLDAADKDGNKESKRNLLVSSDSKGFTPLLLACKCDYFNEETIRLLIQHDLHGSSLLNRGNLKRKQNNLPLKDIAVRESHSFYVGMAIDDLLPFIIVQTYIAKRKAISPCKIIRPLEVGNWDLDVCLLQATIECYELFGSYRLASSVLSCIIRNGIFQPDRMSVKKDHAGNLTLHIACLSETKSFDQILKLGERYSDYGISSEDATLMEYLVRACPAALESRNFAGELPLHCAIRKGRDWETIKLLIEACPATVKVCTKTGELPLHLAIKYGRTSEIVLNLWNLFQQAVTIVDRSTGLLPFQLAACIDGMQNVQIRNDFLGQNGSETNGWDSFSLSFLFLREYPTALTF